MRVLHYSYLLACLSPLLAKAQPPILPDLYGEELVKGLSELYYPETLLTLSQAKDTLYSVIDIDSDDSVRCIYSEMALSVPPDEDPSQAVFMNGNGINLEHIWPQSKGAGDGKPGQSDMHHLAPSRVDVNSARANNPFGESPDNQTNNWYYLDYTMMSVPSSMTDEYSEAGDLLFEPREDRKGDIARAMFYFYSIHNDDADQSFFDAQLATLCQWHLADPVDQRELSRAESIASYQGNMNPFLLDCTLPARAFCGSEYDCTTSTVSTHEYFKVRSYVFGCQVQVEYEIPRQGVVHCRLYSTTGRVYNIIERDAYKGMNELTLLTCNIPAGLYIISLGFESNGRFYQANPQKVFLH